MSAAHPQSTVTPSHRDNEHEQETGTEKEPTIPGSWELSPQQRAFIDLFSEDDEQKQ